MTEIDFGAYLSEGERKEIVVDEFKIAVRRALATKNDVERFIGNVAYVAIGELVDELLETDARRVIAEKAATIIRDLTPYTVFQEGDRILRNKPSLAQQYLNDAVKDNKDMIDKRVKRIINEVGREDVRWALKAAIDEAFGKESE